MRRASRPRTLLPRATLLAGLLACAGGPDREARPSIVVVIPDDLRFDALGVVQREQGAAARFPWLATPSLDRLAAEGVRFRNAFAVSSLCAPSRAAMLTGLWNHRNGIVDNATPLDPMSVTYASLLRAAGYRTGYVGKWHMGQQRERPGFEWAASYEGQGIYFDCTFLVDGRPQPTRGWVDDVATDFAVEFLRRHAREPFLLVVSYKTPHVPHELESVPPRGRGRYRDVPLAPPPNAGALAPYQKPRPQRKQPAGTGPRARVYFELVSAMDEALGRLLAELDALGISGRTVVLFAGDNGYLLGEHGRRSKRTAYEASIRIPLLVRWPGLGAESAGRVVDAEALNVDLAPTLLDLAGVEAPGGIQGRSLRALLEGERPAWRRAFLYEYYEEPSFSVPTQFALRRPDAKLVVYPDHPEWTQLFDLANDPGETRNLAGDPDHETLLQAVRLDLEQEARALGLDPARFGSGSRSP